MSSFNERVTPSLRVPNFSPFSRSIRSITVDSFRFSLLGLCLGVVLVILWTAWFFFARVSLYEVAQTARLEVNQSGHPLEASVGGRILNIRFKVGEEVKAGSVLIELDAEEQRLRSDEERLKVATISPQLKTLHDEITAEENAERDVQQTEQIAVNAAKVRFEDAEASARFAQVEVDRSAILYAQGVVPQIELEQHKAEAQKRRAMADGMRLEISRLESNLRTKESEHRVNIERLNRQVALLEGQLASGAAAVKLLGYEKAQYLIRAPVSGRLGELGDLRIGAMVRPGEKLGVIIPQGELKAVAYFLPRSALGRIRPGMSARLQLEGFPSLQYGRISGRVINVASETREGHVRVELALDPNRASPIPFQHGLPGTVEVEIDRVSPARLLLRVAGTLLATPGDTPNSDKSGTTQ
jgi:multidrug resistance efflux pump